MYLLHSDEGGFEYPINMKMKAELNLETSGSITQLTPQHCRMPARFLDTKTGLQLT
jgi:hypothetical protein